MWGLLQQATHFAHTVYTMLRNRDAAKALLDSERPVDVLLNNAGVMACPYMTTKQGFEYQFGARRCRVTACARRACSRMHMWVMHMQWKPLFVSPLCR